MIIKSIYSDHGRFRSIIKNDISKYKFSCIDIGGSMDLWSYPECLFLADMLENHNIEYFFKIDLNDESTWINVLNYVNHHGKFDFSICSHTLEDVLYPIKVCSLLENISHKGYIAIPSKKSEFSYSRGRSYRGEAHHKNILDVKDNKIIVYPKFNWIENDIRSDEISSKNLGVELSIWWENSIPIKNFDKDIIFRNDQSLIQYFYKDILT